MIGSLLNGSHKTLEEAVEAVTANNESDCDSEDEENGAAFRSGRDIISVGDSSSGWKNNQQLSVFTSAAVDYFQTREFQGLTAEVPQGQDLELHDGTFGVASEYRQL